MTQTKTAPDYSYPRFPLGKVFFTASVERELRHEDIWNALNRHRNGDWGDLCDEDKALNEDALENGGRLLSAYFDRNVVKFWIITEADRNSTTVLLPNDY